MSGILNNKDFYDSLACDYDEMISFYDAVERKVNALRKFILTDIKTAADIGCGTGVDSIALAKLGLNVTAFDPSLEMVRIAKHNSKEEGVKINFQNYPADEIPGQFYNSFDLVISLGNTFANIEKQKFNRSIHKCYDILNTEGTLLIQVLNYKKILSEKERIVNITEKGGNYYIRFYDFINDEINFNLLKFNRSQSSDYKLITTKVFPYIKEDFSTSLDEFGIKSIQYFSGFDLKIFDEVKSKDLVVKTVKG